MDSDLEIAARHKRWRKEYLKMTQTELQKFIDRKQSIISNYENGRQFPPIDVLRKYVAEGLNVNWLIAGMGDMIRDWGQKNDESNHKNEVNDIINKFDNRAKVEKLLWEAQRLLDLYKKILDANLTQQESQKGAKIIQNRLKQTINKIDL